MNAATAGGLLGGEVSTNFVHKGTKGDGKCEFVKQANASAVLRVEVSVMDSPAKQFASFLQKCGATAVPLNAVGNYAVICSVPRSGMRVVGRVRDQAFVITLVRGNEDSIKRAAEVIAGNLF